MSKLNINIGSKANDKAGDTLRTAFDKINLNFSELYTLTGGTSTALTELAQDYAAPLFNHASHTNITATYDDANNKILLTGVASAVWPVANTAGASGPTKIAIGVNAGLTSQAAGAVAIGNIAGVTNQGQVAVAIGMNAGNQNQGSWATAVGSAAGYNAQGTYGVAVGYLSGYTGQGSYAVAVGAGAANGSQGANAVAVGYQAGNQNQGAQSIAIGTNAGATSQAANTIILNATGSAVNGVAAQTDSFYVAPIRSATATSDVLYYNTTTKEITYAAAGSVSSLVNGVHTLSLGSTGNTTFPTGLTLGAPRGVGTVNFTCSVDKEFQIETGTASAGRLWQFGTTGTTTFPSGLTLHRLSSSYSNITADLNKILQVATQTSGGRKEWSFGTDGTLTLPAGGTITEGGGFTGAIKLTPAGGANAYQALVIYPTAAAPDGDHLHLTAGGGTTELYLGNDYHYVKLVNGGNVEIKATTASHSTSSSWTFGTDGSLTFPNATVQTTAYIAPTTGNSVIDSINPSTISRNGMTIRVTSAGMIQMSFNSVIGITGRSSINNADSAVIASPNGATVISTWYNIGAVLAVGDHLTATIVDASFHRIYRLTVTMRDKTTGPDSATAYAIIEQLQ
jgi:hypothetical protein